MKNILSTWLLLLYQTVINLSLHPEVNKNLLVQYQVTTSPVQNKLAAELKPSTLKSILDRYRSEGYNYYKRLDDDDTRTKKRNFRETPWPNRQHNGYKVFKVPNFRRRKVNKDSVDKESVSSSSRGERDWKDEFQDLWLHKKFEALNNHAPASRGDQVNIAGARPWGIPCGDQNQHDSPWGTCSLPSECEDEYRIYRGDSHCGRTHFVCCAVGLTVYDMYQGFDISLAPETDTSTDSEENEENALDSKETRKLKEKRDRRKRKKKRKDRSRKMKKLIKTIIKKIRRLLYTQNRNSTSERRKKTKTLKKFLKNLKKHYKQDRKHVVDAHESELIRIDDGLREKLKHMLEMNQKFNKNATYREMLISGKMTERDAARMLLDVYPEIGGMVSRRSGQRLLDRLQTDHDVVEYGYLYF